MNATEARKPSALSSLALPLLALVLAIPACGGNQVRNQAPFVQVSSWSLDGHELVADLHLRNVNDEELPVLGVDIRVQMEGVELVSFRSALDRVVPPRGLESISLDMRASSEGTALLDSLRAGERASLPYRLQGHIVTSGNRQLRFDRDGHIYNVPGRPGQFR